MKEFKLDIKKNSHLTQSDENVVIKYSYVIANKKLNLTRVALVIMTPKKFCSNFNTLLQQLSSEAVNCDNLKYKEVNSGDCISRSCLVVRVI